ncbi:MAG: helix-turn-helix domain-containing protein [Terracidiphilus sp.]
MESEKWNKSGLLKKYIRNSPMKWKMSFTLIPTQILMDERLSRSCLVVFWVLTVHIFRGKKFCFPSTATIAREAHSSRPTVIKAIKELEQYGYLDVERTSGGVSKYYLKVLV